MISTFLHLLFTVYPLSHADFGKSIVRKKGCVYHIPKFLIESSYAELPRVIDSVEHKNRKAVEFQSDFYVVCEKWNVGYVKEVL